MPYADPKKQNRYYIDRKNRIKAQVVIDRGGKCERCGFQGHPACFDFHHRIPAEKSFTIAAKMGCVSHATLLEELAKCDMICANCHRLEHV